MEFLKLYRKIKKLLIFYAVIILIISYLHSFENLNDDICRLIILSLFISEYLIIRKWQRT